MKFITLEELELLKKSGHSVSISPKNKVAIVDAVKIFLIKENKNEDKI